MKHPDLTIDAVGGDLPDGLAGVFELKPVAEMGGQRLEVEAEAIGGEDGEGETGLPAVMQCVDDGVGQVEGARAEAEDGNDLGGGVDRGPNPDVLAGPADIGPEFIELNVSTAQVLEEAGVEFLGLETGARKPGTQGLSRTRQSRSSTETSTPSAKKVKASATRAEWVFKRYKTVWRRTAKLWPQVFRRSGLVSGRNDSGTRQCKGKGQRILKTGDVYLRRG